MVSIAFALILLMSSIASAITVDGDGSADYTTIQEAVDASSPGDTIQVSPGVYYENIDVDRKLTITSTDGADVTSIVGSPGNPALYVSADEATISGFTISCSGEDNSAIYIVSDANTIRDNILGVSLYAIIVDGNGNEISNNDAYGQVYGIRLSGDNNLLKNNRAHASDSYVSINDNVIPPDSGTAITVDGNENEISNNDAYGQGYGIRLSGDNNLLNTNTVHASDIGIDECGKNNNIIGNIIEINRGPSIRIFSSIGTSVSDNTIEECSVGISVDQSQNIVIDGNSMWENDQAIIITVSDHSTITNNKISSDAYDDDLSSTTGIVMQYSDYIVLENNNLKNNEIAIHLYGCRNNELTSNYIVNDEYEPGYGIYLQESTDNSLSNNYVHKFRSTSAIYLYNSDNNELIDNNAGGVEEGPAVKLDSSNNNLMSGNAATNIHLVSSDYNTITDNDISDIYTGILLTSSSYNSIYENFISGIYLGGSNNELKGNEIKSMTGEGLRISGNDNVIEGNVIYDNDFFGIYLNGDNHVLTGNRVYDNGFNDDYGLGAIYLKDTHNCRIYDNFFNNTVNAVFEGDNNIGNQWYIDKTAGTNIIGGDYIAGNYWATPEGTGFSQVNYDINGDGICDSAYSLNSDNIDSLPLTTNTVSSQDYPRTLTVDDSGGADYTSIQAAVDAAFPGEFILVSPGSYNENIDVDKQLTITSRNGASATNVIAVSAEDNVFEVTANSVTISGFSIDGAGSENEDNAAIYLSSDYNIVTGNTVSDAEFGICAYYSDDNDITENTMQNSNILVYSASSNVLSENTVSNGMIILSAGGNNILSENVVDGGNYGINLYSSAGNLINNNILTDNSAVAIVLDGADSNTLSDNTLSGSEYGIEMMAGSCTLTGNTISDNDYGILMRYSDDNVIYNNIFNNNVNIVIESTSTGNVWNTEKTAGVNIIGGGYLGGNYWATPDGTGFSQINYDSDGDGICESAYVLDSDNVDNLPLTPNEAHNKAPTASIGSIVPDSAIEGSSVSFSGSGTDSDGSIVAYNWESSIDGELSTESGFSTSGLSAGTHTISFSVQDDDEAWSDEVFLTLVVNEAPNQAPTADIISISPNPVTEGNYVYFAGSGSDIDGEITAYSWESSLDGNISSSPSFSISTLSVGTHTIYLYVRDDDGEWSSNSSSSLIISAAQVQNSTDENADSAPPVLANVTPSSGTTFEEGTSSVAVRFNYSDVQSGVNTDYVVFIFDYVDVTNDANTTVTESYASYTASVLGAGTHNASVYVVDNEGNSASFSTTFTIDEAIISDSSSNTSTATSSTSSSSGGGGGGGGGTTGEEYDNILLKEAQTIFVINDAHVIYEFTDEDNAISSVEFDSLKNSGSIQTIVEVLDDRSSFADSDAPGTVYQQMNIWVGKSGFVSDENVENLLITFRVEKSWLTENNIGAEDIALYRYADDRWHRLETTITGEDANYVYFKSETPGFSPFAIASESGPEPMDYTAGEILLMSMNEPAAAPLAKSELQQAEATSSGVGSGGLLVLLGTISVIVAGGYILYRKQE